MSVHGSSIVSELVSAMFSKSEALLVWRGGGGGGGLGNLC